MKLYQDGAMAVFWLWVCVCVWGCSHYDLYLQQVRNCSILPLPTQSVSYWKSLPLLGGSVSVNIKINRKVRKSMRLPMAWQ